MYEHFRTKTYLGLESCSFAIDMVSTVHNQTGSDYTDTVKQVCMQDLYRSH
jgi:hypothetical protein